MKYTIEGTYANIVTHVEDTPDMRYWIDKFYTVIEAKLGKNNNPWEIINGWWNKDPQERADMYHMFNTVEMTFCAIDAAETLLEKYEEPTEDNFLQDSSDIVVAILDRHTEEANER